MQVTHDVVVIGAGISGIAAAVKLRSSGLDVLLVERSEGYGGTWRANTYPGCACDVPSGLYSFSFAPNAHWSRLYGTQPEILAYIEGVARAHRLDECTRFGVAVTDATWQARTSSWRVKTSAGEHHARYLIAAAGPWSEPRIPDVPGLSTFPGHVFHSARWDHSVDLTDKRVAVIGSGASAVQFLPQVQPEVAELHLYQRTAHWVLPKPNLTVGRRTQSTLKRVPALHSALRQVEYGVMEAIGAAFHHPRPYMHALQAFARAHLRRSVPNEELRAKLTPGYLLGCKRILFSNDYLPALTRPNVEVHAAAVSEVRGSTMIDSDGTAADVDVVILGTGFHMLDMPVADLIHGRDGRTLAEHWNGSPEAYLGTAVPGFPNAFVLLGPSLGSGHASAFTVVEAQVELVHSAIKAARRSGWDTVEVSKEAARRYVDRVQRALPGTAYNQSKCNSYYLDSRGRNTFSWPWSTSRLVEDVSTFRPQDFETSPLAAMTKASS